MSAPLYELTGIRHFYGGREALRLDHLAVPEGASLGLYGPNGSGKSTLLRVLAFLLVPSEGTVAFAGRAVTPGREPVRAVSLLLQDGYLLKRSVFENVAYGLRVRGLGAEAKERVAESLDMVGLDQARFARRQWFELSGGERQRAALAARLAIRPRVLLLDEPTASLDPESAGRIEAAVAAARERFGATVVASSHDRAWLSRVSTSFVGLPQGGAGA